MTNSIFDLPAENNLFTEALDIKPNITVQLPEQKQPTLEQHIDNSIATAIQQETHVVLQDAELRDKMQRSAATVVEKKVDTIVKKTFAENNLATSELEEEGLAIFGYQPGKSVRKWQVKWASIFHAVLSAIWMFVAMFTFAPIVFIARKLHNFVKVTWLGLTLAIVIYFLVLAAVILPIIL